MSNRFNLISTGSLITCLIILILLCLSQVLVKIPVGHIGAVYDARTGLQNRTLRAGWHFKIPFIQEIYKIRVARRTVNMFGNYKECNDNRLCDDVWVSAPSKEGLDTKIDISVFYTIRENRVISILKDIGFNYDEGTIIPRIRSSVRDAAGKMGVIELYSQGREELESKIYEDLVSKFGGEGFVLEEVLVRDIKIPEMIVNAIREKQRTEQEMLEKEVEKRKEALEAERKMIEANGTAQKKIIESEGTAESIRIINEALEANENYIQWETVKQWDGKLPQITGGSVPFVDVPMNNGSG